MSIWGVHFICVDIVDWESVDVDVGDMWGADVTDVDRGCVDVNSVDDSCVDVVAVDMRVGGRGGGQVRSCQIRGGQMRYG